MNIVDYAVLGLLGVSVLFGLYRGFISSMLNTGGCLLSFALSFWLYPQIAGLIQGDSELVRSLLMYTDATSRIGDLETAITNVATLSQDAIAQIVSKVQLPPPLDTLLTVNLQNQVYASTGVTSVADYVSETILTASVNVICFLLCFAALYVVISILLNVLRAVFRFPVLKQLDALAGGVFGFIRGVVFCYAIFAVVPMVLTMIPFDEVSQMIDASKLAAFFNNGNLILAVMNRRL